MARPFQGFMHQFPEDILGNILDGLHGDKSTLFDCSLVSRVWMKLTRAHAFSEVTISHQNVRGFLDLLSSPGCTFVTTVRSIFVLLVGGSQKWFLDFSRRLPRVTGFVITTLKLSSSSRLAPVQEEVLAVIPAFYPSLRQLDMGQIVLPSVIGLMNTMSNLPVLEGFACAASFQVDAGVNLSSQIQQQYSGTGNSISLQHRDTPLFSPSLHRLALVSSSIEYCLGFFAQRNAFAHITALSLFSLTLGGIAVLSSFMASPHLSLQKLSIKIDSNSVLSGVSTDILLERLNMSNLAMLSDFTFEATPPLTPSHARRILDSIASKNLASVAFNLTLVQGTAAIDVFLTDPLRFRLLKRVHILGSAWADARQYLPRCHARQILWSD